MGGLYMSEKVKQIANRIRELREIEGYSQEKFAKELFLDKDTYVTYESGETDLPISFLYEVAGKLKVDLSTILTGSQPKLNRCTLVRNGEGLDIERSKQYKYKSLAYKFSNKKMEPLLVTVEPQPEDEPIHLNTHPGQEMGYVLEGNVIFSVGGSIMVLNPGDTLYFDSNYPHGMKSVGTNSAKILTIILQ